MKVKISFGQTTVVVPCGDGNITVSELINLAILRYKKTIEDPDRFRVSISSLKWDDGRVLDPDDIVSDVCDEREHLVATFHCEAIAGHSHGGRQGDEMSGSSGTSEEDIFDYSDSTYSDSASTNNTAAGTGLSGEHNAATCLNTTRATNKATVQV